jgi:hypothetical protein
MRKLTVTITATAAILAFGLLGAEAQTQNGAASIKGAAQNFTPIEPAACRGWGPHCRPGFTWRCGWRGCWCRPC